MIPKQSEKKKSRTKHQRNGEFVNVKQIGLRWTIHTMESQMNGMASMVVDGQSEVYRQSNQLNISIKLHHRNSNGINICNLPIDNLNSRQFLITQKKKEQQQTQHTATRRIYNTGHTFQWETIRHFHVESKHLTWTFTKSHNHSLFPSVVWLFVIISSQSSSNGSKTNAKLTSVCSDFLLFLLSVLQFTIWFAEIAIKNCFALYK